MRNTVKYTMIVVTLLITYTSATAQTLITSCNTDFMDIGGDSENYLNNENSEWLICPDTISEYLEIHFTHVNIETAFDSGIDSTGCHDLLYIYDGMDDTAPLVGAFCGEESGSGDDSFIEGHTLRVGDTFKPANSDGCFFIRFESDNAKRLTGWNAEVTCCTPTLRQGVTDGVDLPMAQNGGDFFNLEIDNSCVRQSKLEDFTSFEPSGSSCYTGGLTQPNKSFYAFQSNLTGGFVELLAEPVDSVGIIEMLVFGPVQLDSASYSNGVINDCVEGENPWSLFFNAGPDQTYILAVATELQGRTAINALSSSQGLGGLLPIRMETYDIKKEEDNAILSWTTSREVNNEYFEIYRSSDAKKFDKIGTVNTKSINESGAEYSFYDNTKLRGTVYYYVRQIDKDGSTTDFDILSVHNSIENNVSIYPNPSNGVFTIDQGDDISNSESTILIFNQLGQLKYQNTIGIQETIDLSNLEAGIYTIQRINEGNVQSHQHIISK